MNRLLIIVLIISFCACDSEKSNDAIKVKIKENKEKISELQQKNLQLDSLLKANGGGKSIKKYLSVSVKEMNNEFFSHQFQANGEVEAIKSAFISPEMNGQIKAVHVKEGQRVTAGQLLVSLNNNVLKNTIEEVKTSLELATTIFNKKKELWEQKIGSEIDFLQAKNQKESLEQKLKTLSAQLDMTFIKAPFAGIVDEITLKKGELAAPGMQVIRLVNLSQMYVNAEISERYLASIKKGDSVWVEFPTYEGMKFKTKIHRTGNVINPQNRTFKIQLKVANIDEKLKPNIMAIIHLSDYQSNEALLLPSQAIKQDLKGKYIYKITSKNNEFFAKKIYIKTGLSDNTNTMITKGISRGEKVIIAGAALVKDGSRVKIK